MADKTCKICGTPLTEDDRFCPNCGAKAEETVYPKPELTLTPDLGEPEEELSAEEPANEEETPAEELPEEEPAAEPEIEPEPKKEVKPASETMKAAGETAKKAAATVGTAISEGAKAFSKSPITKNILTLFKDLWRDPAKTIEKFSAGNHFVEALIVVVFASLLAMLFVLRLISKMGNTMGLQYFGLNWMRYIPASFYFTVFLLGIVIAFIFALLMWGAARFLFRRKYTFKDAFSSVGVAAAFLCWGLVLAILLSFLSEFAAGMVLLFTYIMAIIGLFVSLLTVAGCRPNQAMYSLAIIHVLGYLAVSGLLYLAMNNLFN